jgi:hypothetical protein
MAKMEIASPEIQELVENVAKEMGLTEIGIEFQALNVSRAKEVVKVQKASEVTEILSNKETLIIVIVYEEAFNRVTEKDRWMWIRQALDRISYDMEKDKVSLVTPMVSVPLGFYQKYGNVALENAELALLTIQQIEDEVKQRKAEKAKAKSKKNRYS